MLNYLVCSTSVSAHGSGVTHAIIDHMKMIQKHIPIRLCVIDYSSGRWTINFPLDVEIVWIERLDDILKLDGVFYVHSPKESKILTKLKLHHFFQMHQGDLFIGDSWLETRERLHMRTSKEIIEELEVIKSGYASVICQTKEMAKKLEHMGVKALYARQPVYQEKLENDHVYDLCITGSTNFFKAVYLPLLSLPGNNERRIAVVMSTSVQTGGQQQLDDSMKKILFSIGISDPEKYNVDWFFGVSRGVMNSILSKSKRILHPSFIECYPLAILEASQYTTVMTNHHAEYHTHLGYKTIQVDPMNTDDLFGEPHPPAINLSEHNRLGEEEWKVILRENMKLLV